MNVQSEARFEVLNPKKARIMIHTTVEGSAIAPALYCSGPIDDVKDHFDGVITMEELLHRWRIGSKDR